MIFLTGIKHCGKSTLGRLCARELRRPFYDLDSLVWDNLTAAGTGKYGSIREYYRREGKGAFQEQEVQALRELISRRHPSPSPITALGGGTLENPAARELCRQGFILYLKEAPEVLFSRIMEGGIPPFLEGPDPWALFQELYRRREDLYQETADRAVSLQGAPPREAARYLCRDITELEKQEAP